MRAADDRAALALSQRFGLPEVMGRILAGRGVGVDDAEIYLNPSLAACLPDPSQFADLERAAQRLAGAIMGGEKVAVFGDYDVDGATSSALLKRFFRAAGVDLRIYIPDRQREGYGPNIAAFNLLAAEGAKIIITVDCGTTAFATLQAARAAGLEVIVVDHHLAELALPDAFSVINPNRIDSPNEHGQLAAVGVAFMLVVAINRALRVAGWYRNGLRPEPDLKQWLDLVALGTICDVVPLTGVNRALVRAGLKILAQRSNPGLCALADVAGLKEPPGVYHAGFALGPRINAGGRVGQSDLGARLLCTDDPAEAKTIAAQLDRFNIERKSIEADVLAAALAQLPEILPAVVVAVGEGWHPGVIGIVASRLKEVSHRPSLVVALAKGVGNGGIGKGSGRSISGIDLGAAITAARQAGLLVDGGGHAMAAGFTVEQGKLGALRNFLELRIGNALSGIDDKPSLGFDGAIRISAATAEFFEVLGRAGPYGSGNPEPRLAIPAALIVHAQLVGEKHVRCILSGGGPERLKAIAFGSFDGALGPALMQAGRAAEPLHLAGHLRADHFRGEQRLQFVIEDASPASGQAA
jgi:single-stranded-DNA-specific exonuclease